MLEATRISASTGEPFYVSGQDYNIERVKAFLTGDFSGLTEAFLTKTRAGDTRDILDLVRSQQSMLKKLGLLDIEKPLAIGVEVQARLFLGAKIAAEKGEAEGLRVLSDYKELHRAYADVIPEEMIFKESLEIGETLGKIMRGELDFASADREIVRKSLFYTSFLREAFAEQTGDIKNLQQISFGQFAGRFLLERGESEERIFSTSTPEGYSFRDQIHADNNDLITREKIATTRYRRERFTSYTDLVEQLTKIGNSLSNVNTKEEIGKLTATMQAAGNNSAKCCRWLFFY